MLPLQDGSGQLDVQIAELHSHPKIVMVFLPLKMPALSGLGYAQTVSNRLKTIDTSYRNLQICCIGQGRYHATQNTPQQLLMMMRTCQNWEVTFIGHLCSNGPSIGCSAWPTHAMASLLLGHGISSQPAFMNPFIISDRGEIPQDANTLSARLLHSFHV